MYLIRSNFSKFCLLISLPVSLRLIRRSTVHLEDPKFQDVLEVRETKVWRSSPKCLFLLFECWMWTINLEKCSERSHQPTQCLWFWDHSSGLQCPRSYHPPLQCLCGATSHDHCSSQSLSQQPSGNEHKVWISQILYQESEISEEMNLSFLTFCFSHHEPLCACICVTFIPEPPAASRRALWFLPN